MAKLLPDLGGGLHTSLLWKSSLLLCSLFNASVHSLAPDFGTASLGQASLFLPRLGCPPITHGLDGGLRSGDGSGVPYWWGEEQNQGQLLEYVTGRWVVVDAVYWDRKDRRRSRFEWGKKWKSSVWDLLIFRCLWTTQWKDWRGHPMWGSRGSLEIQAE